MRPRAFERIRAVKVAYITNRLNFTPEQSASFWPVYNRYEQEIRTKREEFAQKYANTNPEKADDATSRKYIDDNLDYQQEVLNIRRKYNDEFLKVLSPQQVAELYQSEKDFNKMLIQQLNKRRGGNKENVDPAEDK
jgi:Spy/CpxP family protein refolding chaperone